MRHGNPKSQSVPLNIISSLCRYPQPPVDFCLQVPHSHQTCQPALGWRCTAAVARQATCANPVAPRHAHPPWTGHGGPSPHKQMVHSSAFSAPTWSAAPPPSLSPVVLGAAISFSGELSEGRRVHEIKVGPPAPVGYVGAMVGLVVRGMNTKWIKETREGDQQTKTTTTTRVRYAPTPTLNDAHTLSAHTPF